MRFHPTHHPAPKRRKKSCKAKAVSPEPATVTTVPKASKPTTTEVSVQTDLMPPSPPQKQDMGVQTALQTYAAVVQTCPQTQSVAVETTPTQLSAAVQVKTKNQREALQIYHHTMEQSWAYQQENGFPEASLLVRPKRQENCCLQETRHQRRTPYSPRGFEPP